MAATFEYGEDHGNATDNPARGTTRDSLTLSGNPVTNVNWKNIGNVATNYAEAPIAAGANSFTKYQFGYFSGTFNQISNCIWGHVSGELGAGLTLVGKVTSSYATPSTTALAGATDMTALVGNFAAGEPGVLSVNLSDTGPQAAGGGAILNTSPGYTQYLVSQLQTDITAAAGDTATATLTLRYDEN